MATGKEKAGPSIFKKSVGIAPVFLNTGNASLALILGGENPLPRPVFYGIILENNKKKPVTLANRRGFLVMSG